MAGQIFYDPRTGRTITSPGVLSNDPNRTVGGGTSGGVLRPGASVPMPNGQAYRSPSAAPAPAPAAAAPAAAPTADPYGGAGELARQMTARRLMLLRQGLQRQQVGNVASLRRQLAQRGALDSGSLGAGTTQIGNHISDLLARGTQEASLSENSTLLDFLKARQRESFDKERQQSGFAHQEYMARLMQQFQQENEPSWWESLLGGIGNVGGQVAVRTLAPLP